MDNKDLLVRLKAIQNAFENDRFNVEGPLALSQFIGEVENWVKPIIPDWVNSQGLIDPDMIDDNTFDDGPIEIQIVRIHQMYTNACQWEFRDIVAIQNDQLVDQFMDHMCENYSYEDHGDRIPDEYLLKVLIGRDPERKVLNAFRNGQLSIGGLEEEDAERIFRDWDAFFKKDPVHLGFMIEEEGIDT